MSDSSEPIDSQIARRHTASHIMTAAVKMMFPNIKLGVGPWTDEGFYQDFDFGEDKISSDHFKEIEKKMRWIVNKDFKIVQKIVAPSEALELFANDPYKKELILEIVNRGEDLSFYVLEDASGKVFSQDLCSGPHLASTGQLGAFQIMKIAGAYWRGNEQNPMLTRIYGVVFQNEEELVKYQTFLEEVAKRDHRKLGAELDLFTFSEKVGAGLPLFTPKGTFMRNKIEETIMGIQSKYGFEKVHIPHITKKDLYETSGHWDKFKDDLFHVRGKQDTEFVMKPMNCPHHTQIYASKMRSYRDLPIRYAETTTCYRDELPGELLGLSRVRSLTQDDGHIFCTIDQVKQESKNLVHVIREFYTKMGMFGEDDFWVSLSVRDMQNKQKYLGKEENWEKAEQFLEQIAQEEFLNYKRIEGEAAFYGPKLDFQFKDALGRQWQLATVQIDFVQPERFGLSYISEKGEKEMPVMIHRAVAGSLERFMSVIIEHFNGAFPLWLAPVQCALIPVAEAHTTDAEEVFRNIKAIGGRAVFLDASDSLGKRIRESQTQKIHYTLVIGDKEIAEKTISLRKYGEKEEATISRERFLEMIQESL
jgi:threonyl-tRNA synthetase